MIRVDIPIEKFSYELPAEKIAKFPLAQRDQSKLLIYDKGNIRESQFCNISSEIDDNSLIVCNNTKVIHARLLFFKESGAKIEIFCLEPHLPADHERAFSSREGCQWLALVGGRKKWKEGALKTSFKVGENEITLSAEVVEHVGKESIIKFSWNDSSKTFGELLEVLGTIPIPPYLCRQSEESDNERYQTIYSKIEGSVAAPTAGLHFTDSVIESLKTKGCNFAEVTLHVGAGTFLPVKSDNAADHQMHIEHFIININTLEKLTKKAAEVIAVGTTSVRTIESLSVLGYRVMQQNDPMAQSAVKQWEAYEIPHIVSGKELLASLLCWMRVNKVENLACSTQIMITPGYKFRVAGRIITNFHQPQSTLLLLISAAIGEKWHELYDYALTHDFRFLSYGDSSILTIQQQ